MTINYSVTEQDYINFNMDYLYSKKGYKLKKTIVKYVYIIFMYISSFIIVCSIRDSVVDIAGFIIPLALPVFFIFYYDKQLYKSQCKAILKLVRDGKSNDFIGNQTLTLADDCIETSSAQMSIKTQYSAVEKILTGHDLYYIYIGALKAIIIPKSAFHDEDHTNAFFSILKEKTGIEI